MGFKCDIALHRKVDTLSNKQGNSKSGEISHATSGIPGDRVIEHICVYRPQLQMNQLAGDITPVGGTVKDARQEGEQQILQ